MGNYMCEEQSGDETFVEQNLTGFIEIDEKKAAGDQTRQRQDVVDAIKQLESASKENVIVSKGRIDALFLAWAKKELYPTLETGLTFYEHLGCTQSGQCLSVPCSHQY
jgi:hypothetical protein